MPATAKKASASAYRSPGVWQDSSVGTLRWRALSAAGADTRCLFQGQTAKELSDVAPYLLALDPKSELAAWLFGEGWGQSWGIHVVSAAPIDEVRTHFRHFLMVLDHMGKAFYFRLYDPRVLRVFLPTCDAEQLRALFGPIEAFIVEDDDPERALVFTLEGEMLKTKALPAVSSIMWKGKS